MPVSTHGCRIIKNNSIRFSIFYDFLYAENHDLKNKNDKVL